MIENFSKRTAPFAGLVTIFVLLQSSPVPAAGPAAAGRQVYNTYCVLCHGTNMVNSGSNAPDLRKFPKSQKGRFVRIVKNGKGRGKMPAWGDILSPTQINNIWAYVKARGEI